MVGRHRHSNGQRSIAYTAVALCLIAVGVYFVVRAGRPGSAPVARGTGAAVLGSPATSTAAEIPGVAGSNAVPVARPVSRPVHLSIASIGVSTDLQPLGLLPDGSLQPPSKWAVAGWYADGVVPGQTGPAVIAGHIDSTRGPAVFYRLRELAAGARISVTEQNGAVLSFVVDGLQSVPKDHFPTQAVYGPTPNPQLRLITCDGTFDRSAHSYRSNLLVTAHLG